MAMILRLDCKECGTTHYVLHGEGCQDLPPCYHGKGSEVVHCGRFESEDMEIIRNHKEVDIIWDVPLFGKIEQEKP